MGRWESASAPLNRAFAFAFLPLHAAAVPIILFAFPPFRLMVPLQIRGQPFLVLDRFLPKCFANISFELGPSFGTLAMLDLICPIKTV